MILVAWLWSGSEAAGVTVSEFGCCSLGDLSRIDPSLNCVLHCTPGVCQHVLKRDVVQITSGSASKDRGALPEP